jgi:hypothetical protein
MVRTTGTVTSIAATSACETRSSSSRFLSRPSGTVRSASSGKLKPATGSTRASIGLANHAAIAPADAHRTRYPTVEVPRMSQKHALSSRSLSSGN